MRPLHISAALAMSTAILTLVMGCSPSGKPATTPSGLVSVPTMPSTLPAITPTTPATPTSQAATPTPADVAPPTPTRAATSGSAPTGANIEVGKSLFQTICNGCHPGGSGGVGPYIKGASASLIERVVRNGAGPAGDMPAFSPETISDQQIVALAAYLASLK